MKSKTKIKLISVYIIFMALILLCSSGCTTSNYRRKEFKDGLVVNEVHLFNNTFLVWARARDIQVETVDKNGVKRSLAVGDFEQKPDTESIKVVTDGVVDVASGGATKILGGGK